MGQAQYVKKMFYAFTLYSVDYLDFDQLYMFLKILVPEDAKKTISFIYPHNNQVVSKKMDAVL